MALPALLHGSSPAYDYTLMRWPWSKPERPVIPKFQPEFRRLEPKDPDIIVTEEELSQTGLWRLFPHKKPKE